MGHDLSHLNDMQREAVLHTEGPLLVLAGAGSGKTTVLIERIGQILRQGTAPWSVLAITFTNKAAGELKTRLERMLGPDSLDIWATTFHSACVRILRRDIDRLGYSKSFTIYDTDDAKRVLKEIVKHMNLDDKRFPPAQLLSIISAAKNKGQTELETGGEYFLGKVQEVYSEYTRRLKDANATDFDDLILLTVRLLKEFKDVREFYQKKFRYIVVDEYQDTNLLQYELVSILAKGYGNICVVGDDDQSIYRFRGATIENILNFERQYKDARVIRLEQNYRSTGAILECANKVIAKNHARKGKTLWTGNPPGEHVAFYAAYSDNDEARYVADTILEERGKGRSFRDFCVLYRMNAQSNRVENAFKAAGIPYRIIGGARFYDRMEVRDMLAYLQVLRNPEDDLRLLRIINTPARGIGEKTVAVAQSLAARDRLPLFDVLRRAGSYPELQRQAAALVGFASMLEELALSERALPELYDLVLEKTGYLVMLEAKNDVESQGRKDNVLELKSNIAQYAEENPDPSLGEFLDQVALITDVDKYDTEADAAVMMTIHSAKGLEFPVVFLVGAEENIFPGTRSMADLSEIEEERRLCYVAATRAEEKLHVTCARERMLFGQTTHNPVSRFVLEMGLQELPTLPERHERQAYRERQERGSFAANTARVGLERPRAAPAAADYAKGEMLEHKVFGRGMLLSITPMGNDALLEVAFDGAGTKRLMMKSAAQYIKKVDN